MKIIVAQRHEYNLTLIKARVERLRLERSREIVFLSSPSEVLEEVVKCTDEKITIISGQIFGTCMYGTDLARHIKSMNSSALFFICSVMPAINDFVDGVIPKVAESPYQSPFSLLAEILVEDLENFTTEFLKAKYPQIKTIFNNKK